MDVSDDGEMRLIGCAKNSDANTQTIQETTTISESKGLVCARLRSE